MGLALGPRAGPNTLTIGDAAGTVNPFNGEGIAYGYETGRLAAGVVAEALLRERLVARSPSTTSASRRPTATTTRWRALSCA